MGAGVETEFTILTVLKGDATLQKFVLHHYREAEPEQVSLNGPGLPSFEPKRQKAVLLFLKRAADGRYTAVSGQTDPDISVRALGGYV
jgi:hypothetical protein